MKPEFDLTKMVEEIAMQAKENQEEFIFETIHPYCENVLQMKINKEELKQILLNSIQKQPSEDCISRKEAINEMSNALKRVFVEHRDIAEKAMNKLPSVTPSYNSIKTELKSSEDCISKKIVLDMLEDINAETEGVGFYYEHYVDYIKDLPSVTPSNDAIKEAYIKGYDYGVKDWFKSNAESCEDCISRQAVIDINEYHHGQMPNHVSHEIWKEIKALPSVTPQPKTGRWIDIMNKNGTVIAIRCDSCGNSPKHAVKSDFCPNCGVKMEVEE